MKTLKDLKITEGEWEFGEYTNLDNYSSLGPIHIETEQHGFCAIDDMNCFLSIPEEDAKLISLAPLMRDVCIAASELRQMKKPPPFGPVKNLYDALKVLNERLNDD